MIPKRKKQNKTIAGKFNYTFEWNRVAHGQVQEDRTRNKEEQKKKRRTCNSP